MLGHRGGTHPQDDPADRGHHDRDPHPDRRLRLPGGGGPGPGPAAPAHPGAVRVLGRGPAGGASRPGHPSRQPGRPGRGAPPAARDRAGRPGARHRAQRGRGARPMIGRHAGLLALRGVIQVLGRLLRVTVLVVLLVLAWPVTLVGAYAATLAWYLGWPPRQLYRAAAWCLPMMAAWLAALTVAGQPWPRVAGAPYFAWLAMCHGVRAGRYL